VLDKLPPWPWAKTRNSTEAAADGGSTHLNLARESLKDLIEDARLPAGIRESLAHDYEAVQAMLDKLQHGHLHIAVFGRVSTGKSSLLNALIGEQKFVVSPLHGETRKTTMEQWSEVEAAGVYLIDTPGLDEAGGEDREAMAKEVAHRSDLVIFVVDGDITDSELQSLRTLLEQGRPVVVALNKSDLYTQVEQDALLQSVREKTAGLVDPDDVLAVAAQPRPQQVVEVDDEGVETASSRVRDPDINALRVRLWDIFETEGKTLAALNASLFAADLSDQVGIRILNARREIGDKLVRTYCVAKGIAVAFNPIPVADLFAAAFIDVGMVIHLSKQSLRSADQSTRGGFTCQCHHRGSRGAHGYGMGATFRIECAKSRHCWAFYNRDRRRARRDRLLQYLCCWPDCCRLPVQRKILGRGRPCQGDPGQPRPRYSFTTSEEGNSIAVRH